MSTKLFLSRLTLLYRQLPRTSYAMLNRRLPIILARSLNLLLILFSKVLPRFLYGLIPNRVRYLWLMTAHALNFSEKKVNSILELSFPKSSQDLVTAFARSRSYFFRGIVPNFSKELEASRNLSFKSQNNLIHGIMNWSFWNLNHSDFYEVNNLVKHHLLLLPKTGLEQTQRFLPYHVSHLGHLAMLYLYINYYRKRTPSKTIILPKTKVANSFLLDLIIRSSTMKIRFLDQEVFEAQSPTMIDTLHYSLEFDNTYRTESDCAFFSKQDHPEFQIKDDFVLALSEQEQIRGKSVLESELGRKIDWFVVLHVREPKNRDLRFSQARDANVDSYSELSKVVEQSGGLVIRMGDKSFPKLKSNFPAFDYAYSRIKSEFLDVWLWANCRFWVGNVNGAAFPPIAFKKPRVITIQWYSQSFRPESTLELPKHLISEAMSSSIKSIDSSLKLSRCMDRTFFSQKGLSLRENSREELADIMVQALRNFCHPS